MLFSDKIKCQTTFLELSLLNLSLSLFIFVVIIKIQYLFGIWLIKQEKQNFYINLK